MKKKEEPTERKEDAEVENNQPRKLTEEELEQVTGGTGIPCLVIGPYWGNAMRTDGPYSALCYQPDVFAEYVNTQGNNCKYRLLRYDTAVGWTDRSSLQM